MLPLVRRSQSENHCSKGAGRTGDLKYSHIFKLPGKCFKNINVWFLSQRFQIDCSFFLIHLIWTSFQAYIIQYKEYVYTLYQNSPTVNILSHFSLNIL